MTKFRARARKKLKNFNNVMVKQNLNIEQVVSIHTNQYIDLTKKNKLITNSLEKKNRTRILEFVRKRQIDKKATPTTNGKQINKQNKYSDIYRTHLMRIETMV